MGGRTTVRAARLDGQDVIVDRAVDFLPPDERTRRFIVQAEPPEQTQHRSAWTSTLLACLEMAKQGELMAVQEEGDMLPVFRHIE